MKGGGWWNELGIFSCAAFVVEIGVWFAVIREDDNSFMD